MWDAQVRRPGADAGDLLTGGSIPESHGAVRVHERELAIRTEIGGGERLVAVKAHESWVPLLAPHSQVEANVVLFLGRETSVNLVFQALCQPEASFFVSLFAKSHCLVLCRRACHLLRVLPRCVESRRGFCIVHRKTHRHRDNCCLRDQQQREQQRDSRLPLAPAPGPLQPPCRPRPDRLAAQPAFEILGQRLRRAIPPRGILAEAFQTDGFQVAVEAGV